jgi:hypothetical protein
MLTPAIFAMSVDPSPGAGVPPLLALVGQMKWGFIGLVMSVLMMGWILSRFIRRFQITAAAAVVPKKAGDV